MQSWVTPIVGLIGFGIVPPRLEKRNRLYSLWLCTQQQSNQHKFTAACSGARRAMRLAKEQWLSCKAEEAERGRHSGKILWRCIRDIKRGRRDLVPMLSSMVRDEEGNACFTSEEQQERWRIHFTKILNVQSKISADEMSRVCFLQVNKCKKPLAHVYAMPFVSKIPLSQP